MLGKDLETVRSIARFMHPHALPRAVDDAWTRANGRARPHQLGPYSGDGLWDTAVVTTEAVAAGVGYALYPVVLPAAATLTVLGGSLAFAKAGAEAVGRGAAALASTVGAAIGFEPKTGAPLKDEE